ncbi:Hsp20/alpha crystallin family protein [Actinomarinicola tropica]|uniref:Hsp20 family protein n=1 Tax=Actinomarinicola tropica TaxID=2789776 RepID=A0A5Q2RD59_9ACTN|nr:Hsp20/alpha crystallin family protein [Actinomarinicola tropica]QGG94829.1 Hsp20 family protein [Actinomarinicola tropica]
MLLRWDPFRDIDRTFDEIVGRTTAPPALAFDAVRRGDTVVVSVDLPGVSADAIDLTVERNVLTVKAERRPEQHDGDEVLASERRFGTFTRQLFLGDNLDTSTISADHRDGVLTITIPVAETAKPRKVEVAGATPEAHAIEATTA